MSFKSIRENKDFRQSRLAHLIGVDVSTVQAWEAGENLPNAKNMAKLKEVLGAEVEAALLEKKETETDD